MVGVGRLLVMGLIIREIGIMMLPVDGACLCRWMGGSIRGSFGGIGVKARGSMCLGIRCWWLRGSLRTI